MSRRAGPRAVAERSIALLLLAAALLSGLALTQGAFLSSDEMYGFTQSRALLTEDDGEHRVPYGEDVGAAFVPMGSGAAENRVEGGVSPLFVAIMSPLAALGPGGAIAGAVLVGAAFVAGLYVLAREAMGSGPARWVALVAATSLPIAFWSTLFMANVPTATFFVWGMAFVAVGLRRGHVAWTTLAVAAFVVAVGLRRDSLPLLLPALAAIVLSAPRLASTWLLAIALAYLAIGSFRYAVRLAGTLGEAFTVGPAEVREAYGSAVDRFFGYHPPWTWADVAAHVDAYVLALFPVVVGGALLGLVAIARARRRRAWMPWSLTLATGAAYLFASMTITADLIADPPGVFSSLVRYAILAAAGLAALAAMALVAFRTAPRAAVLALAAFLVVPTALAATLAEPGVVWAAEQRASRVAYDRAVDRLLPANGFLIGDEASKFVTSRPVLVPNSAYAPLETYLPPLVDRLADRHGLRAFIHEDSFKGDWTGVVGEYLTDRHHVAITHDEPFLEILWTETRLANVGILERGGWELEAHHLRSTAAISRFDATPLLAEDLTFAPAPALAIRFTVRDDDAREHSFGYLNAPEGVNDVVVLHRWQGAGTGAWRTEETVLPADSPVTGAFFVSGGLLFGELTLTPLGGVVER